MSHDHHDEAPPEYKQIIPFTLIACALFSLGSCAITQNGLASRASAELGHSDGFEQVDVAFKGTQAVLAGNVGTAQLKDHAEQLVSTLPGVSGIAENTIEIGLKPSPEAAAELALVSESEKDTKHATEKAEEHPPAKSTTAKTAPKQPEHDPDSHADVKPVKAANPFAALLQQNSAHTLKITATVTAHNGDVEAITKAQAQVDQLKAEIIASGNIAAKRVSTTLNAQLSSEHQKAHTALSYIIE
jgi:hypothetical protein